MRCSVLSTCAVVSFSALVGCGGGGEQVQPRGPASGQLEGLRVDDRSRCDFRGRSDRDVRETTSPGSVVPNVRRVYGVIGKGEDRRRVLLCREVDTNLDGMKDVVRTYNDQGEKLKEQADANYDGRIDTWYVFAKGRIQQAEFDRNGDGTPDETRYYAGGLVSRIQRDTNGDGKPDVFEVYDRGRLERIGVDANFDGSVDRWDRDEIRAREEAEREAAKGEAGGETSAAESEAPAGETAHSATP